MSFGIKIGLEQKICELDYFADDFFLFIKKFLHSLLPSWSSPLNSRLKIKGATAFCSLRSFYACFAIFSYNSFDLSLLLLLYCSLSLVVSPVSTLDDHEMNTKRPTRSLSAT